MSVQIALLAPATRVASRKLGPTAGMRWDSSPSSAGGLGDEQVGEHVRQVRDAGHQPVVGPGVDRLRARPEAAEQPVQTLVEDTRGAAFGGSQVPRRAVEQVLARVLHAGGLGAGERVTADEALVGRRESASARLIEPTSVTTQSAAAASSARRTVSPSAPTGVGSKHDVGARDGRGHVIGLRVDRSELERLGAHGRVGVIAAYLSVGALARSQPDRAADQTDAEDRDPHPIRSAPGRRCDRARTRASASSTSTVVSQLMQPSVIDCP